MKNKVSPIDRIARELLADDPYEYVGMVEARCAVKHGIYQVMADKAPGVYWEARRFLQACERDRRAERRMVKRRYSTRNGLTGPWADVIL